MNISKRILQAVVAVGMVVLLTPSALRAESAAPFGDAGGFLGALYDPKAAGPKLSGTMSIIYDKTEVPVAQCSEGFFINKIHISITMGQNQTYAPFTAGRVAGFCMGQQQGVQAQMVVDLMNSKVIPFYLGCTTCPSFKVKSITDYQYTTGAVGDHPLPGDPTSGGLSATFTIAIQ